MRAMSRRVEPMHPAVRLAALGALLFVLATFAAPLLASTLPGAGRAVHAAFAPLCHQLAERSVAVAGATQSVCARCAGLYAGGALGLLLAPLLLGARRRLHVRVLLLACAPTAIDALLPWVGLPQLPLWPRLVISVPAGFAAGLFLALGVDGAAREWGRPAAHRGATTGPPIPLEELDA